MPFPLSLLARADRRRDRRPPRLETHPRRRLRARARSGDDREPCILRALVDARLDPATATGSRADARACLRNRGRCAVRSAGVPRAHELAPDRIRLERREVGKRPCNVALDARPQRRHAARKHLHGRRAVRHPRRRRDAHRAQRLGRAFHRRCDGRRGDSGRDDQAARRSATPRVQSGGGDARPCLSERPFGDGGRLLCDSCASARPPPGPPGASGACGFAAGIAVAVAASRVLLDVHWLTDVIAGLALGWAWFAVCAIAFGGRILRFGAAVATVAGAAESESVKVAPHVRRPHA